MASWWVPSEFGPVPESGENADTTWCVYSIGCMSNVYFILFFSPFQKLHLLNLQLFMGLFLKNGCQFEGFWGLANHNHSIKYWKEISYDCNGNLKSCLRLIGFYLFFLSFSWLVQMWPVCKEKWDIHLIFWCLRDEL